MIYRTNDGDGSASPVAGRHRPGEVVVADDGVVACMRCGRQREQGFSTVEALAWVAERHGGGVRWMCPGCARVHVRDIEGKLPPDYW